MESLHSFDISTFLTHVDSFNLLKYLCLSTQLSQLLSLLRQILFDLENFVEISSFLHPIFIKEDIFNTCLFKSSKWLIAIAWFFKFTYCVFSNMVVLHWTTIKKYLNYCQLIFFFALNPFTRFNNHNRVLKNIVMKHSLHLILWRAWFLSIKCCWHTGFGSCSVTQGDSFSDERSYLEKAYTILSGILLIAICMKYFQRNKYRRAYQKIQNDPYSILSYDIKLESFTGM